MADRLYKISEIAKILNIPKRTCLFYSDNEILIPFNKGGYKRGLRRVFDSDGLKKYFIVHELMNKGISLKNLKNKIEDIFINLYKQDFYEIKYSEFTSLKVDLSKLREKIRTFL